MKESSIQTPEAGDGPTATSLHEPLSQQLQLNSESRFDPISGEWTIFAPHRQNRPNEFRDDPVGPSVQVQCPFCRGQEHMTPDPVWVGRPGECDGQYDISRRSEITSEYDWSVRVVPNLFPAVLPIQDAHSRPTSSTLNRATTKADPSRLFRSTPVAGGHEVIIESPDHVRSFAELDLSEAMLVMMAYRDRIRFWRSVGSIGYISVFKNVGGDAGASLQHGHSQLIATNNLPASVRQVCDNLLRHHAQTGCCLQCDLLRAEIREKSRVIYHSDDLVAYCPYASRLPMLVRLTSLKHQDRFEDLDDVSLENVARLFKRVVMWVERLHPGVSYNCLLHTRPPAASGDSDAYHWSIEIFPRLTRVAGFEWSSNTMINPVMPELAAERYRACAVAEDPRLTL
jgi:UDPglucose--hexose-1-phosphate uridylyltransferase